VARLFGKTFRKNSLRASPEIERYLHELLFEHPWRDPELNSLVSVGRDGALKGFVCVLPVRMSIGGRPVRAALAGSLMVDEPEKDPLAGARLLRSYFKGPQDLSFSDTSNLISRRMWDSLGGSAAPLYGMDWIRLLRPAGAACALIGEAISVAGLLRPLGSLFDYAIRKAGKSPRLEPVQARVEETGIDDPALLSLLIELAGSYRLAPQWSRDDLSWFLPRASEKERYGALVCKIVHGKKKRPLGCFLYYGRPGGIAFVLQIMAEPGQTGAVVDALLADAYARGCAAVRGRTQPELIDALQLRHCFFVHRSSLTYASKDAEIVAAIKSGEALLTGLCGEAWTRLIGGFVR
jgi:hypothetical protein